MADLNAIKEQLDTLTLVEAAQLVKMLEEAWGVSAAAPVAVAAAGPAAAAAVEANVTFRQGSFVDATGKSPCKTVRQLGGTTRIVSFPRALSPTR